MFAPSSNGSNGSGRDSGGRFARGNAGGPGNPYAKRTAEMKAAFMAAITPKDMRKLARRLYEKAVSDDKHWLEAMKLLLDHLLGKPTEAPPWHDASGPQYPILVTTTAEALKQLEARGPAGDDPLRGLRRLSERNPDE